MLAKDIMSKDVTILQPDDTIEDAAKLMNKNDIGCIPVCKNNNLVGIVTDRDIVIRNVVNDITPSKSRVEDVMSPEVTVVYPEMNIKEVSEVMAKHQIRRVPVVENNVVVGIIAMKDVALHTQSNTEIANTIIDISKK